MRLLSLSTDDGEVRLHAERIIANARVALSAGGLVAVYLDPAEPIQFAAAAYTVLIVYGVLSLAIALALRARDTLASSHRAVLYGIDLVFPAILTTFTAGAGSPLFAFVWFAMLAAASRSGLRGAFATATIMLTVVIVQTVFFSNVLEAGSLNFMIVRATLLGVMAFMLGYLTEKERDLRLEAVAVARVLGRSRGEQTLAAALEAAIDEITQLYSARSAVLAITQGDGSRHLWVFRREPAGKVHGELKPVTDAEAAAYFFDVPEPIQTWLWRRNPGAASSADALAIGTDGNRVRAAFDAPAEFWSAIGADEALGSAETYGDTHARLFLPSGNSTLTPYARVHLLHTVSRQIGPALVNVYLLRAHASETERARIARELHDRVIQSLIGLEMQMVRIERQTANDLSVRRGIEAMRHTLRGEIGNVRDLMHELRLVRVTPEDLPFYLADLIERFQRQTGIRATFHSEVAEVPWTPRQCATLVKIVQEALVNVRKHSKATAVSLRLSLDQDGHYKVSITDDGEGFPFSGRWTDEQLWAQHKGPLVIKERARSIGAALSVESAQGEGARLEVLIPRAS